MPKAVPISEMTPKQVQRRFFHLKNKRMPIPDNLNQRMAECFPGKYDPIKRDVKITRKHNVAVSEMTPRQAKDKLRLYRKSGKPVPEELNKYLMENWPGYDPIKKEYRIASADELTLEQAKSRYYTNVSNHTEIPDDLNERLARDWLGYDPVKRRYTQIPVSEMTPQQAKWRFERLKQQSEPIPDDLNEYLAKIWRKYDPVKRDVSKASKNRGQERKPLQELSKSYIKTKFRCLKNTKKPIPDALNEQMAKHFPNTYDPIKRDLLSRAETAMPLEKMTRNSMKQKFYRLRNAKKPIPDALNKRMAAEWPGYDPKLRDFTKSKKNIAKSKQQTQNANNINIAPSQEVTDMSKSQTPYDPVKGNVTHKQRKPASELSQASARCKFYNLKAAKEEIPDDLNERLAKDWPTYDPELRDFTGSKKTPISELTLIRGKTRYNYYVRNKKPVPDELNEFLGKNWPGYDPEMRKYRRQTKDASQLTLEQAKMRYNYFICHKKPIPDDLNERLAKDWPGYDPVKRKYSVEVLMEYKRKQNAEKLSTLANKGNTTIILDVSNYSTASLKTTYYSLLSLGISIPDNINKALAEKCQTYDPITRTFTGKSRSPKIKKDITEKSATQLKNDFFMLKRFGISIPDNMNTWLTVVFWPNYNPNTRNFIPVSERRRIKSIIQSYDLSIDPITMEHVEPVIDVEPVVDVQPVVEPTINQEKVEPAPQPAVQTISEPQNNNPTEPVVKTGRRSKRQKDFASMKLSTLRNILYSYKSRKKPVPAELDEELSKRDKSYDPITHSFKKHRKDLNKRSPESLKNTFFKLQANGEDIPDDMNELLAKQNPNYDPETRTFSRRRREKPLDSFHPQSLRNKFRQYKKDNKPIPDDLNEVLADTFKFYDPEKRDFVKKGQLKAESREKTSWVRDTAIADLKQIQVKEEPIVKDQKIETIWDDSDEDDDMMPNVGIDDDMVFEAIGDNPEMMGTDEPNLPPAPKKRTSVKISAPAKRLNVITQGEVYKTVLINNVPVIKAEDVELKTFLDDTVLGVHYTDKKDVRQWKLWDAATRPMLKNNKDWVIESVNGVNGTLYIMTDTRAQITMSKDSILRDIVNAGQYVIKTQESKKR